MIFIETPLQGAYEILLEKREDRRGFFARWWAAEEFAAHGLKAVVAQANVAYNTVSGTLRGLHYQIAPHEEAKLIKCTRGAIFDVIVDLRSGSPTYTAWVGVELTADSYKMLYVPENFAHGYITVEDHTEVTYLVSRPYAPESERGVRYDDPAIGIHWPVEVRLISDKDASWPNFSEAVRGKAGSKGRAGGDFS